MRILITGSSKYDDYDAFKKTMNRLTAKLTNIEVVTGPVYKHGTHRLAQAWAFDRRIVYAVHHPDERKHGKKALEVMEKEMVKDCKIAVVFVPKQKDESVIRILGLLSHKKRFKVVCV